MFVPLLQSRYLFFSVVNFKDDWNCVICDACCGFCSLLYSLYTWHHIQIENVTNKKWMNAEIDSTHHTSKHDIFICSQHLVDAYVRKLPSKCVKCDWLLRSNVHKHEEIGEMEKSDNGRAPSKTQIMNYVWYIWWTTDANRTLLDWFAAIDTAVPTAPPPPKCTITYGSGFCFWSCYNIAACVL